MRFVLNKVSLRLPRQMSLSSGRHAPCAAARQTPVVLFDVMDTIVKDPFFVHMPAHFDMTFKELLAAKHPTTWVEFEKGLLTEEEMLRRFFDDGRFVDGARLKAMLVETYDFLPGMRQLLQDLRAQGYELHAISNYPVWYKLIEEKLRLSSYMPWTFVSSDGVMKGLRKPDRQAYELALEHLAVPACDVIFVDDRAVNVEAAVSVGMRGVTFKSAHECRQELIQLGVELPPGDH